MTLNASSHEAKNCLTRAEVKCTVKSTNNNHLYEYASFDTLEAKIDFLAFETLPSTMCARPQLNLVKPRAFRQPQQQAQAQAQGSRFIFNKTSYIYSVTAFAGKQPSGRKDGYEW